MYSKTLIIIADYGTGDPAFTEVMLRLRSLIPSVFVYPQAAHTFSTINTGFWIKQLSLTPDIKETYIFANTAPRLEDKKAQKNNNGEKLMYAQLTNGFEIMAVNAGYAFSFVKPHIAHFYTVNVQNEGSQFRSRDFYPQAVAKMIQGDKTFIGQRQDPMLIPDYPTNVIASIDAYGNIKSTIRESSVYYAPGQHLEVTIGNTTKTAMYTDGVFNVDYGQLAFAPGSSGNGDRFMELFVRGGNARTFFENPSPETHITIKA